MATTVEKITGISSGGDNVSAWPEDAVGRADQVFVLGTSEMTSSSDETMMAVFGWYCVPFMLPKKGSTVINIRLWVGAGGSTADEFGWALYDGITGLLLDSGVKTGLAAGAAAYLSISGVSAAPSDRSVILATLAGENGVGNQNWDVKALDNKTSAIGLPIVNTNISQKNWLPWGLNVAGFAYDSAEADINTGLAVSASGFNDELMLASLVIT